MATRVIGVIRVIRVICGMFIMVIMRVVFLMIVVFFVIVMPAFYFKFGTCFGDGTLCRLRRHKQIKRTGQSRDSVVNCHTVFGGFGLILEPDNICPGRPELHHHTRSFNRNVERPNPMFMRIKLARCLRKGGRGKAGEKKGERRVHRIRPLMWCDQIDQISTGACLADTRAILRAP
jgi:hypothetical protein